MTQHSAGVVLLAGCTDRNGGLVVSRTETAIVGEAIVVLEMDPFAALVPVCITAIAGLKVTPLFDSKGGSEICLAVYRALHGLAVVVAVERARKVRA